MKRVIIILISTAIFFLGCNKDDASTNPYSNRLSIGLGINDKMELTGISTSFPRFTYNLWFRLESSSDMINKNIWISLEKIESNNNKIMIFDENRGLISDTSYFYINSFSVEQAGSYTLKGYLEDSGKKTLIASSNFSIAN